MDSDYSVDGGRVAESISSDDDASREDDGAEKVPSSPLDSPGTPTGSPPRTPPEPHLSRSPQSRGGFHRSSRRSSSHDSNSQSPAGSPSSSSRGRRTPSGSPSRRTPSGSPPRRTPSGSPPRRTPSGSPPRRSPSGSPPRRTPSGSPSRRTPSGSPPRRTPSGSPPRRTPSGSPPRRTPSGSPPRRTPSRSPLRRTPSGSPPRRPVSSSPSRQLSSRSPSGRSPLVSSKRSPSVASSRQTPSSASRRTPSGSPPRRSPSGSPRHGARGSPSRRAPSRGSSGRSPSGSPSVHLPSGRSSRRTPSGSPSRNSPPGSPSRRWRTYPHRPHGKRAKRRNGDSRLSDASDDGHSNISSSSSFAGSPERVKEQSRMENGKQAERKKFEPHKAEDLSDVSDLDSAGDGSLDSLSDDEGSRKKRNDLKKNDSASPVRITQCTSSLKDLVPQPDEMEQLDFEAEEPQAKEDREEGECGEAARRPESSNHDHKSEADDGEVKADEVEEGEITDEDENRPEETEPRPICRFYNRGQCTWGSSCRFLHPGVTDKGNYTMFDMVRPLVPANGPPLYGPMMDYRAPMERPMLAPMGPIYSSARKEEPASESAWERGLRTAKEMMRKASKRKETDIDFEEKKMNLSLGQDELDKENDYYTRPASPALEDELDRWSDKEIQESKHHRVVVSDRYDAMDPYYPHHRESRERWSRGGHYDEMRMPYGREPAAYDSRHHDQHMAYRAHMHHDPNYYPDKYDRKKKSHTVREVIVQHSHKSYKEERSSSSAHKGRGDEWADPWMRSKSPTSRKSQSRPSRRQSYSSASSYSSTRSSRSYSSSYSRSASRSRSRSRSKSISRSVSASRSRSRSPGVRRAGRGYRRGPGTTGAGQRVRGSRPASPGPIAEKRIIHMNPPAPSPRNKRPPSPGSLRKIGSNPPPPPSAVRGLERKVVGGKVRRSKSSRSSSSDSSGSSSDSSGTSLSSSSSSRDPTPPPAKPKKIVMDERLLAQSTKVKAMDALKLSGQKQQIKLTLKTASSGSADDPRRSAVVAGKKRVAESPPPEPIKAGITSKPPAKKTTSRREELLKQLKAVEDAIARKRSKIT